MVTVMSESRQLEIPEELVQRLGFQAGSRFEWTPTSDGLLLRLLPDRSDMVKSLRGAGRRLVPHAESQVEALWQDREDELAFEIAAEEA
jgi:bifunctional DNA-binding transcriptional regulator/antitoxin component of YhaV-PrlF toxin-antitoxin module